MIIAGRAAPPIEVHANRRHRLGIPPARFLRDYWQKRPLLIRGAFPDFTPPLSPDDLAGLACMDGALARIITRTADLQSSLRDHRRAQPAPEPDGRPKAERRGRRGSIHVAVSSATELEPGLRRDDAKSKNTLVSRNDPGWEVRTGPFKESTFAQLPEQDWTLLVQDVDKWDADTADLLDDFAFIPNWRIDDVMVSYAADGGGVGAHVDQYDVFLLQGVGQRRWSIDTRPNPSTAFREDVELKLLRTFRATHEWTLDPGDMLYLPPGVPHDGVASGECMTFSIGMRAPAVSELLLDFAERVAVALPESQRYADPDLAPATASGEIDAAALRRARRTVGPIAAVLGEDAFADWFGSFATRYRCAQLPVPRRRPVDRAMLAKRLSRMTLRRDPWSRLAWRRKGQRACVYALGTVLDAPVAWAKELASGARSFDGAKLARLPQPKRGRALLAALIDAGHVTYRYR